MHTSAILMNDWVTADGAACVGSGECPNQIVSRLISRNLKPEPAAYVLTDPGRLGPMKQRQRRGACSWCCTSDNSVGGKSFHLARFWKWVLKPGNPGWWWEPKGWAMLVNQSQRAHTFCWFMSFHLLYLFLMQPLSGLFFFSWDVKNNNKFLKGIPNFL